MGVSQSIEGVDNGRQLQCAGESSMRESHGGGFFVVEFFFGSDQSCSGFMYGGNESFGPSGDGRWFSVYGALCIQLGSRDEPYGVGGFPPERAFGGEVCLFFLE